MATWDWARALLACAFLAAIAPAQASKPQDKPAKKSSAQQDASSSRSAKPKTEEEIKSGLIFNFCRYIRWSAPPKPTTPFEIKVVGTDPLGADLDKVFKTRTIQQRPVVITRVGDWATLTDDEKKQAVRCQLLVVGETDEKTISAITAQIGTAQVLTVGFVPEFVHYGGDIEVYVASNKVRFDVDRDKLKKKSLRVSSKLLRYSAHNPLSKKTAAAAAAKAKAAGEDKR